MRQARPWSCLWSVFLLNAYDFNSRICRGHGSPLTWATHSLEMLLRIPGFSQIPEWDLGMVPSSRKPNPSLCFFPQGLFLRGSKSLRSISVLPTSLMWDVTPTTQPPSKGRPHTRYGPGTWALFFVFFGASLTAPGCNGPPIGAPCSRDALA